MKIKGLGIPVLFSLTTACGGGGGSSSNSDAIVSTQENLPVSSGPTNSSSTGATIQPATGVPISLLQRLETLSRTINGESFHWACEANRRSTRVGYIFGSSDNYSFTIGSWQNNLNTNNDTFSGSENFRVTSGSENSIVLNYEDLGATEEITNISFVSNTNWTGFSSTDGTLNCFTNVFATTSTTSLLALRSLFEELGSEAERLSQDSDITLEKRSDGSSGKLTN